MRGDEVRLWRSSLDPPSGEVERMWALLSPDERTRAERFHSVRDRHHFIAAHGILRRILGAHLSVHPTEIEFGTGPHGKPWLSTTQADLRFNMAHSGDMGVWVIAYGREVGVDLERMRTDIDCAAVGALVFSPAEAREFAALPLSERRYAFFRCWTRKEAYIKGTGDGLAAALPAITVTLAPHTPGIQVVGDEAAGDRWTLQDLVLPAGYVGALAVEGHDVPLVPCWLRAWGEDMSPFLE